MAILAKATAGHTGEKSGLASPLHLPLVDKEGGNRIEKNPGLVSALLPLSRLLD